MIRLIALAGVCLAAAVGAVPLTKKDVGSTGYDYKPPPTSYGVPSGSIGAGTQDYRISTAAPFAGGTGGGFEATTVSPLPAVTGAGGLQQSFVTSTPSPLLYSGGATQGFQLPVHEFTNFNGGGVQGFGNAPLDANAFGGLVFDQGGNFAQQINPQLVSIGVNGNQGLLGLGGNQGFINAPSLPNVGLSGNQGFINAQDISSLGISGNQGLINGQNVFIPGGAQSGDLQSRYNVDEVAQGGGESEDGVEPDIEVSRHLYFFSSVDDIPAPRQRINLPRAPKKQNLKVLFIKAPAIVTPPPVIIPAQKQNEEKTVVYVLVKKPEEPTPIEIETPPTTPPSKPDVFFIKYNTQQEAEEAVAKIQKQQKEQNVGGGEISELLSSRFSQDGGINVEGGQSPPLVHVGGLLTTTVSPLQFAGLAQGGPFVQTTSEAPQVVFNSPAVFSSTVLGGGEQQAAGLPSTSIAGNVDNVKALSESFGGPTSSNAGDSDVSGSVDLSSRLGGPTSSVSISSDSGTSSDSDSDSSSSDSDNEVTPHSTYGVPDKRFIHRTAFRPAPFKRGVTRFRF